MGTDDKMKNAAQGVEGDIKAAAGRATGDKGLEAEGKKDQVVSDLKQAGEKIKDAFRRD